MDNDATDLRRHLRAALDAETPAEKNFHVRQALQHCDASPVRPPAEE